MKTSTETCAAEVDRVNQADWHRHLQGFADANIYQTWSYGATRWGENSLSHLVPKNGSEILGLAQLRIVRAPVIGSGIAYLRWGPLFHQSRGEPDAETF